ncbi:MAG: hypothetical protein ACLR8Y_19545 [Alistipes indistinctus]
MHLHGGCAEQFDEAGQADKAHMLGIAVLAEIGDSGRELPELAVTMIIPMRITRYREQSKTVQSRY